MENQARFRIYEDPDRGPGTKDLCLQCKECVYRDEYGYSKAWCRRLTDKHSGIVINYLRCPYEETKAFLRKNIPVSRQFADDREDYGDC